MTIINKLVSKLNHIYSKLPTIKQTAQEKAWLNSLPANPIKINLSQKFDEKFYPQPSIQLACKRSSVAAKPASYYASPIPPVPRTRLGI